MSDKQIYLEVGQEGLICDNPDCSWEDSTVTLDNYAKWLNAPCPVCGENVLTDEDLNSVLNFDMMVKMVNSMTESELNYVASNITPEVVNAGGMFENPEDVDTLFNMDGDIHASMDVNFHKGITIKNVKIIDDKHNDDK